MEDREEKERAKQIIVEIVRQAGGVFYNTTNMYKAFYRAHLRFADAQPGYLSAWPIVHMPRGPGIHDFNRLLGELLTEDRIAVEDVQWGENTGSKFRVCEVKADRSLLPKGAVEAIAYGVGQVKGKSATQVTHESHQDSRAWREATQDGEELNIYLDSLSDLEYEEYMSRADGIATQIDAIWG